MFTVNMYCSRMNARGIRIGLVVDCTALDLEEFVPLPDTSSANNNNNGMTPKNKRRPASKKKNALDRRVRYFHNPSEWDDFDVEYVRLVPPKKDEEDDTNNNNSNSEQNNKTAASVASEILPQFIQIISKYIQKSRSVTDNSTTTTLHIALFDSRGGLGVASYFAAAYMCHSMKAPVYAALDAVREGSPPQPCDDSSIAATTTKKWGLCDVLLVKDLQSRYHGNREIVMEGAPRWWYALEDDEEDGEDDEEHSKDAKLSADANEGENESSKKRRREERIVIPPSELASTESNVSKRPRTSNDNNMPPPNGKPGLFPNPPREALDAVSLDSPKATRAMTVLAQLTQRSLPLTSLPFKPEIDVSNLSSDSDGILQSIKSNPDWYKATWLSTKGRRGLLLILSEAVYFMEQPMNGTNDNNNPQSISISIVSNIRFPSSKDGQKQHHRTLLDVVLVQDVEKNQQCFRFYALDILCIEGGMVWHKAWKERWRFLNDGVLIPRKKEEARQQQQQPLNGGHVYAKELIRIRAKEYFPLQKLEFVSKDVCAGVGHEAKGIRIIPLGSYGIGKEDTTNGTAAVVWKTGGDVDEQQLLSLFK